MILYMPTCSCQLGPFYQMKDAAKEFSLIRVFAPWVGLLPEHQLATFHGTVRHLLLMEC